MTETRLLALTDDRAEDVHEFLRFLDQSVTLKIDVIRSFN
jgi:hypothetical protein